MIMRIVVYDVAASEGGALSILRQYYERALEDTNSEYLFIVSTSVLPSGKNIKICHVPETKKSWCSRLFFDVMKAHRIINGFKADAIISLQNLTVPFVKQKQIVYMHNALPKPFCEYRFSIRKYPKLWVYQNIIGRLIVSSLRRADMIIVQTEWMAKRCVERCGVERKKVVVERPIVFSDVAFSYDGDESEKGKTIFFYPASAEPFKNHKVIVDACLLLKAQGIDDYEVRLTLKGDEAEHVSLLYECARENQLPIRFCGWLNSEQINEAYRECDWLIFPSIVETLGLPLQEAQAYGLGIMAADLEYAHETIGGYDSALYFDPENPNVLYECMRTIISQEMKRS